MCIIGHALKNVRADRHYTMRGAEFTPWRNAMVLAAYAICLAQQAWDDSEKEWIWLMDR